MQKFVALLDLAAQELRASLFRKKIIGAIAPVLLVGCSPTEITQTVWKPSPDGQWFARIVRYDTVGPGMNSLYEEVQVKRVSTSRLLRVFTLDEGSLDAKVFQGAPITSLYWRDPLHLEIDYRAGAVVHRIERTENLSISSESKDGR